MKQYPSRLKFKKYHKANSSYQHLNETKVFFPVHGLYGLKAMESCKLTFKQIEAGRRTIRRTTQKVGKLFINVFTNLSVTKKPLASRMGKGKGSHSTWICVIRKGHVIFELSGLDQDLALKALLQASSKLPVKTKVFKLVY